MRFANTHCNISLRYCSLIALGAKALDYNLKRWGASARYIEDGTVPIDNNPVENQIRSWALGRSNWCLPGARQR